MIGVRAVIGWLQRDFAGNKQAIEQLQLLNGVAQNAIRMTGHQAVCMYTSTLGQLLASQMTVEDYLEAEIIRLRLNIANLTKDINNTNSEVEAKREVQVKWQAQLEILEEMKSKIDNKFIIPPVAEESRVILPH